VGHDDSGTWTSASNLQPGRAGGRSRGTRQASRSRFNATNWTNSGTLSSGGGTLILGGSWTNSGTVAANGGTLSVGGNLEHDRHLHSQRRHAVGWVAKWHLGRATMT